eukprot:jgi/Ulvmu1/12700/UM095_0004.1
MQHVTVKLLDWSAQNDFTLRESLAKGTYGQIYMATHNRSGYESVVKAVHKHISRSQGESTPQQELQLHKYISKHIPDRLHVAKFIAGYEDDKYIYSVMEVCRGPTLASLLAAAGGGIDKESAALLLQKIATATMQLHAIGVLHRDIKPDNLMFVSPCGKAPLVIIDFGLSLYIGDAKGYQSKWSVGSMLYAAPEVTNSGYYTTACDVWSLGILLYCMLFGREPFLTFRQAADSRISVQFPDDAEAGVGHDAIELITWMLKHDFHARPSLEQVLRHPFTRLARDDIDHLVNHWLMERAAAGDDESPVQSFTKTALGTEPVAIPVTNAAAYLRSSHALALEYPELPSLTVPASIRRCQSPSRLEAQSRVHTLSAIADQNWREIELNLAHRTGKQREREQITLSAVQERAPLLPWRVASLQCVRLADPDTGPCSSPHACSVPLQPGGALAMHLEEDVSPSAADGWHGNGMQYGAMPKSRSQLSMVHATISPDLLAASAGSDCRLGMEAMPCSANPCLIQQSSVEAIGSWAQSGGCDLQIGSAPTQSLVVHNELTETASLHN